MTIPWNNTQQHASTRGDSTLIEQRWRQLVDELQTAFNSFLPELLLSYCDHQTAVYGHSTQLLLDDSLSGHDCLTRLFTRIRSLGLIYAAVKKWDSRSFGRAYDLLELTLSCTLTAAPYDINCRLALLVRHDEQGDPKLVAVFDLDNAWQTYAE